MRTEETLEEVVERLAKMNDHHCNLWMSTCSNLHWIQGQIRALDHEAWTPEKWVEAAKWLGPSQIVIDEFTPYFAKFADQPVHS